MAHQLNSSAGSGFFHPFARSVALNTAAASQAAVTAETHPAPQAPAPAESIPTSGGFVNPQARAPKQ
jgi:hypothetical protein